MTKATGPLFDVHFRRRREGRTNYSKRLALLKSGVPRLVVRKLNRAVICQVVEFGVKGDRTIAQASTRDFQAFGFKAKRNVPSAYLAGLLLAKRALAKGVANVIADFGLHSGSRGGLLFAVVKGAIDGGLKMDVGEEKLPTLDRINGKHIGIDIAPVLAKIKEAKV